MSKMLTRACVVCTLYFCTYVFAIQTEHKTPALAPDEKYRDLFPLTIDNYTSKLIRSKDTWIVIVHNGSVDLQWKTMAAHLRGICWVGIIDSTTELELVKVLQFDVENEVARVYPFGTKDIKGRKWQSVKTPNDARSTAVASLPDRTTKLQSDKINDFYTEALLSNPTRFPAYFISDEEDTSTLMRSIAVRFQKYFHFGRLVKPSNQDIEAIGLGETYVVPPALYVIVFQEQNMQKINAIQFKVDLNGDLNYPNVMRFLFTINSEYRHHLPGDNHSNSKQAAEMEDIMTLEQDRFEFLSRQNNNDNDKLGSREEGLAPVIPNEHLSNGVRDEL